MKSFPSPLTPAEEKYYIQKYTEGDLEAKHILIERNLRLVAHVLKKYQNLDEDPEDLLSIGTIGLIKAVVTFNPEKGNRLAAYASRCVEKATPSVWLHFAIKPGIRNPFSDPWKIWKSFQNLHILYRSHNHINTYAVLYIHSALFHLPSRCTIAERHNLLYSSPNQLHTVPEKIRYYRHKHLLHQRDVANALNIDRTVYQDCEYDTRDYYPIELLEKIADFYHIPAENLMDEYHLFLYHDPGTQIKQFRKQHGYTQEQTGR